MNEQVYDDETTRALVGLDEAIEQVAVSIEACGQLVNEGRLDGNVLLLKFHELSARLTGGGVIA